MQTGPQIWPNSSFHTEFHTPKSVVFDSWFLWEVGPTVFVLAEDWIEAWMCFTILNISSVSKFFFYWGAPLSLLGKKDYTRQYWNSRTLCWWGRRIWNLSKGLEFSKSPLFLPPLSQPNCSRSWSHIWDGQMSNLKFSTLAMWNAMTGDRTGFVFPMCSCAIILGTQLQTFPSSFPNFVLERGATLDPSLVLRVFNHAIHQRELGATFMRYFMLHATFICTRLFCWVHWWYFAHIIHLQSFHAIRVSS